MTNPSIDQAVSALKSGNLVAMPTDTVYGLAGDATSDLAVAKIYAVKNRPEFNPLIIHIHSLDQLQSFADLPEMGVKLAQAFWPGPLALILPLKPDSHLSKLASAGLDTVAVRMPKHPMALELLRQFGHPLAAPSANLSGRLSPTTAEHVREQLGDQIEVILEGGACKAGLESTILDLTTSPPQILRPGPMTQVEIEAIIGPVTVLTKADKIKAPGQMLKHYAPKKPIRLNVLEPLAHESFLDFNHQCQVKDHPYLLDLSAEGDLIEAAANLFHDLHVLDNDPKTSAIAVAPIPYEGHHQGLGIAINDRLKRAAS